MTQRFQAILTWATLSLLGWGPSAALAQTEHLASWSDHDAKQAITDFVAKVTTKGSTDFVPEPQRIAVFDNDGTLWSEKPIYFQLAFTAKRVQTLANENPNWKTEEPFASVIRGDWHKALEGGEPSLAKLLAATHANITDDEFRQSVQIWLDTATHPQSGRRFDQMVYQPMLELLDYLRANGFKTFIVTGGGIDFVRVFSERVYGIPPEQVVGSSLKSRFEVRDGQPIIIKTGELNFVDDKAGKPVGIHQHIGRRPLIAVGNSDGDFEMLQWTTAGQGSRLGLLVHHDDASREYAYDRDSHVGRLVRGLDEAEKRGWKVISMKNDWQTIFP